LADGHAPRFRDRNDCRMALVSLPERPSYIEGAFQFMNCANSLTASSSVGALMVETAGGGQSAGGKPCHRSLVGIRHHRTFGRRSHHDRAGPGLGVIGQPATGSQSSAGGKQIGIRFGKSFDGGEGRRPGSVRPYWKVGRRLYPMPSCRWARGGAASAALAWAAWVLSDWRGRGGRSREAV
jgi:hypothetical protein